MARDTVVIGASAGGVEALRQLVGGFPPDWEATVLVVIHLPAEGVSVLPELLTRAGPLQARNPRSGEELEPGTIYVGPPDFHMLVDDGRVNLSRGPRQNRHRPSVDALFRSAAYSHGSRVIGVVLTGGLSDGAVGLNVIRSRGGMTIVQDPADAKFPGMPRSALQTVDVDFCLPLAEIASAMVKLSREEAPRPSPPPKELEIEVRHDDGGEMELDRIGKPSYFTCPECHGTLWEIKDGHLMRYRCRVGHAYSSEGLIEHQDQVVEDSLWAAARTLVEIAHLKERVAARMIENGRPDLGERMQAQARNTRRHAEVIQKLVKAEERLDS